MVIALAPQTVVVGAPGEQVLLELVDLAPELAGRHGLVSLGDVAQLVHLLDPGEPQVVEVQVLDPQRADRTVVPHERDGVIQLAGLGVQDQQLEAQDISIPRRFGPVHHRPSHPGAGRLGLGVVHVLSPLNGG